jgi:hydrogenase expression/formation protein HypE
MRKGSNSLGLGKLKHDYLSKILKKHVSDLEINDERIILGSKIGEDAAVIDMKDHYLVAKTDPITFATDEIGYYSVHVNVNDIVCTGAIPKWFLTTILLPAKKTNENLIEKIFKDLHDTCKSLNISMIGGHTEVTSNLDRPIVVGSLLGEVEKDKLVKTSGAKVNDVLILTKGIFIEGTSIIAREKEELLLSKGLDQKFINKCKQFLHDPGISIYKDALIANANFKINSMHDITEGGLATGIAEIAIASDLGALIYEDCIKILPEPAKLSRIFNLNPYGTISSGSLLISINEKEATKLVDTLRNGGIDAEIIGKMVEKNEGLKILTENDKTQPLLFSEVDEILKIF